MPVGDAVERPSRGIFTGESRGLVRQLLESLLVGHLALPPWQRAFVWTEEKQVQLLDSLMRGISIGAVTLWQPISALDGTRPFPVPASMRKGDVNDTAISVHSGNPRLVLDGQQRITTLLKAASKGLDHWRWDGEHWTTGSGFLTPSMCAWGSGADAMDWFEWITDRGENLIVRRCMRDRDAIARTDISLMTLEGSPAQMIETYRRLATSGVQHSVEDLALMERWQASSESRPS